MRCPKCGYNSFDHLDSCKKCGKDLVEFKQSFGIKSVLFPGQMIPGGNEEEEYDNATADAAVTAATGVTVAETTAAAVDSTEDESGAVGADGDDFGFDFMGDSAADDDLSFDELFEEAPEDEDIEETIEAPKETASAEAELEDDFGFDPTDIESDSVIDDFDFDDTEPESAEKSEGLGTEEGPERPFDLPESPQVVGAPEASLNTNSSVSAAVEEADDLFAEDTDFSQSEEPESYVFESEESVISSLPPVESSSSLAPEVEVAVEVPASQTATTISPPHTVSSSVETIPSEISAEKLPVSAPSLGSCVGAFVCDLVLLSIVGISFVVAAEAAMSTGETSLLPSLETLIDLSIPYFLVLFFLAFGYFTLFHFLVGQTPGKMVTGLRVETTEGEPLAFAQAFLRSVGGLLQLLPAGLGYLLVLFNAERRGWNDRLAGTRVVVLEDLS